MPDNAPRTPRALQRRRRMLEVAVKVFAREGFRNADVQVIADLAGAGKGTIYRHFGNKEELFMAATRASVEWMAEFVAGEVAGIVHVPSFLRRIATACAEYCEKNPETIELMIQERAEFRGTVFPTALSFKSDNAAPLDDLIRIGIERGELRNVNPSMASSALLDLVYGSIVSGVLEGGRRRLVARVEHAVNLLLEGMLAPARAS